MIQPLFELFVPLIPFINSPISIAICIWCAALVLLIGFVGMTVLIIHTVMILSPNSQNSIHMSRKTIEAQRNAILSIFAQVINIEIPDKLMQIFRSFVLIIRHMFLLLMKK